jgi:hypothetical protein
MRDFDFFFLWKQTKNKKDKTKLEHDQQMESFSLLSQQSEEARRGKTESEKKADPQ